MHEAQMLVGGQCSRRDPRQPGSRGGWRPAESKPREGHGLRPTEPGIGWHELPVSRGLPSGPPIGASHWGFPSGPPIRAGCAAWSPDAGGGSPTRPACRHPTSSSLSRRAKGSPRGSGGPRVPSPPSGLGLCASSGSQTAHLCNSQKDRGKGRQAGVQMSSRRRTGMVFRGVLPSPAARTSKPRVDRGRCADTGAAHGDAPMSRPRIQCTPHARFS